MNFFLHLILLYTSLLLTDFPAYFNTLCIINIEFSGIYQ